MKSSTVVLIALAGINAVGATHLNVLGVPPDRHHLYSPLKDGTWACLGHPHIILRYDQINDDYCDCPDGSDEPGTNACPVSDSLFYCENKGHIPGYIERFKLNDGVCDYDRCCDGSDEYSSGLCPDKCQQIHKQYVEFSKKTKKEASAALQERERLYKTAQNRKSKLQNHIDKLKAEIVALKEGNQKMDDSAAAASGKSTKKTKQDIVEDISSQIELSLKAYESKITHLESILEKVMSNYNPNFNDAAVKEAVKTFQDYLSNSENHGEFRDKLQHSLDILKAEPPAVEEVEEVEADAIGDKIKEIQKDIEIYVEDLNKNYGKDDIYRALQDNKISANYGDYNYRIALLDAIHQDKVLVGKFSHFDDEDENILYYTNGAKCWNGPQRSAKIILTCGKKHDIVSVSEPEKCEYTIELKSPIACHELSDQDIINNFKVDYSQL